MRNITSQNIISELQNPKNWKKTHHKIYEVYICRPSIGTQVFNKFEMSSYITDEAKQFVVSGTCGEQWVIGIDKLLRKYSFIDGSQITEEALRKRMRNNEIDWMHLKTNQRTFTVWAFHIGNKVSNFPVTTLSGTTLIANADGTTHGIGDFILCSDFNGQPNLNDCWVVNGNVFQLTYDMRAFPNLTSNNEISNATPVPKSIVSDLKQENKIDNTDKYAFNAYRNYAEQYASKLVRLYSVASKKHLTNIRLNDNKTGMSGNYIVMEDYNYTEYKLTFYIDNGPSVTPASMTLRFMDEGNPNDVYLDIVLMDGEHDGHLYYYRNAFREVGLPLNNITDEHLTDWINNQFGIKTKSKKNTRGGIFKYFSR